jgi:hypothetical protein
MRTQIHKYKALLCVLLVIGSIECLQRKKTNRILDMIDEASDVIYPQDAQDVNIQYDDQANKESDKAFSNSYFSILKKVKDNDSSSRKLTAYLWKQCGGIGYNGPNVCELNAKCKTITKYYYQCVPKRY